MTSNMIPTPGSPLASGSSAATSAARPRQPHRRFRGTDRRETAPTRLGQQRQQFRRVGGDADPASLEGDHQEIVRLRMPPAADDPGALGALDHVELALREVLDPHGVPLPGGPDPS
jgi:hypothetical protein